MSPATGCMVGASLREQQVNQEPTQEQGTDQKHTRSEAIFLRMLPRDFPTLVDGIVNGITRTACIIVGVLDYLHTQDITRFLLLCGIATSYNGVQQGLHYLMQRREVSPRDREAP